MTDKKISLFIYCDDYKDDILALLEADQYIIYTNEDFKNQDVDFVFIETDEDIQHVTLQFELKNELCQFITFSPPYALNKFFKAKGRGVIDFTSLNNTVGKIILNKFLKQEDSIYLDEVFAENFSDYETAGISNHLLSGIFVDKICLAAFGHQFNNVSIRTFLDHVIYYFAYLKQAGLALTPFEFQYGKSSESFILKAHLKVNNFTGEYLFDSFGSINGKDPLFYLMTILYKSSDFMEVSYVESNQKLCITALWSQVDEETGPKGILINNILNMKEMTIAADRAFENGDFLDFDLGEQNLLGMGDTLENKVLPNGFDKLLQPNEIQDPLLNSRQEEINNFLDQMDEFQESQLLNPNNFQGLDFDQFQDVLEKYPEMEFLKDLSPSGLDELKNMANQHHKKDMQDAFNEEMDFQKENLNQVNPNFEEAFLRDSILDEITGGLDELLDVDDMNSLLGQDDLMNEKLLDPNEKNNYSDKLDDFLSNEDFEGLQFDSNDKKKPNAEEIAKLALNNLENVLLDQYADDPWMQDPNRRQELIDQDPNFKLSDFDPEDGMNRVGDFAEGKNGQEKISGTFEHEESLIKLSDLPSEKDESVKLNDTFDDNFSPLTLQDARNEEEVSVFTPFDEEYHDAFVKNLGDVFDENGEKIALGDGVFNEDGETVNIVGGLLDEDGNWVASGGNHNDGDGNMVSLSQGVYDQDGNLINLKDIIDQTNNQLDRVSEGLQEQEVLQKISNGVFDDNFQPLSLNDLGDERVDPNQRISGSSHDDDGSQKISGGRDELLDPFTEFNGISLDDEQKQVLSSKYQDIDEFRQSVKGTSSDEMSEFVKDFQQEFNEGLKNFNHKEDDLQKKKLALNDLIDESLEKVTGREKLDKYMRSYADTFAPSLIKESLKAAALADQKKMEEMTVKDLKKFAKNIAPESLKQLKDSNALQRGFENVLLKGMKDEQQLAAQQMDGMTDDLTESAQTVKGTPQQKMMQKYYKYHKGDNNLNKIDQLFLSSKGFKQMKNNGAMKGMLKSSLKELDQLGSVNPHELNQHKEDLIRQMSDEFNLDEGEARNVVEKSLGKLKQFENQALLNQVAENQAKANGQTGQAGGQDQLMGGDFNLLSLEEQQKVKANQQLNQGNFQPLTADQQKVNPNAAQDNLMGGDFNMLSIDGENQQSTSGAAEQQENAQRVEQDGLENNDFNLLSVDGEGKPAQAQLDDNDLMRIDPNSEGGRVSPADQLRSDGFNPLELDKDEQNGRNQTDQIEQESLVARSNGLQNEEFDGLKLAGEGGGTDESSQLIKGSGGQAQEMNGLQLIKGAQESQEEEAKRSLQGQTNNDVDPAMLEQMQKNASSVQQRAVLGKLNNIQQEKQDLEKELKAMKIQLETEKASNKRLNEINDQADKQAQSILQDNGLAAQSEESNANAIDEIRKREMEEMRRNLLNDIEKGKTLHEDDAKKITKLLTKDNESIDKIRKLEGELRKSELTLGQKDTLIKAEIKKLERKEKTSKLLLDKAKESMKNTLVKKEKEMQGLKSKMDKMSDELKKSKEGAVNRKQKILKEENGELKQSNNMQKKTIRALQDKVQQMQGSNDTQEIEGKVKVLSREKDTLFSKLEKIESEKAANEELVSK
ncbi:hypothetical protein N9N67_03320, partial [Bacteriovoracaceae bacterium]|nr:hypothetical protein [Bacteriovoracaceae bacterium]